MSESILVLNAGSSSLKFSVFGADGPSEHLVRGQIDALATTPSFRALAPTAGPLMNGRGGMVRP